MTDLERALEALGADVDFPPTPDLAAGVLSRLPVQLRRRTGRRWWWAAAAAIVLLVLVALPGPRAAIADLLGIGAVRVTIVDAVPPSATVRPPTGVEVTIDEAQAETDFDVLEPETPPDAVFLDDAVPGGMVTLAYEADGGGAALFITQLTATTDEAILGKSVGPGTSLVVVDVAGTPGFWIEGEPHVVLLIDRGGEIREDAARLAGNTLIVVRDNVTIRIEGAVSREDAVEIATSLR